MKQFDDLLRIPIGILPCTSVDTAGDKTFGDKFDTTCYAEAKVQVVKDREGKEVVSNTTFYIENDGSFDISHNDVFIFNTLDYEVRAITSVYEIDGTCVLWMVYV